MGVGVNTNAEKESVPVPISANVNAIELTEDFDVPSQIGTKKTPSSVCIYICMLHTMCKES